TGGLLLLLVVTEVRKRVRLLLSKDATVRESHHRVKNNLQTISSLLQLQARRSRNEEARYAIAESVRRIGSIALVHETLSREAGEEVAFTEILRPLVQMVAEAVTSSERRIEFQVSGDAGKLPAQIATPMAVVLTELLQNTADHAFPTDVPRTEPARVRVDLDHDDGGVTIRVVDNGVGVPDGFSVANASGLGLSIVRALVTSDLGGTIDVFEPPEGPGTVVELRIPMESVAS
ncbi:MAG: sensor histidine kinase, partial [Acidimicrobiales bacterium]|nr:sensor histidine kinase [Acidimicrobiales bacterium]